MQCPNCDIPLMMTERKGIEIDFCTQCRGIWLDRGELDKIIEISTEELTTSVPAPMPAMAVPEYQPAKSDPARQYRRDQDDDDDDDDDDDSDRRRKRYRERSRDRDRKRDRDDNRSDYSDRVSVLELLFDFFD